MKRKMARTKRSRTLVNRLIRRLREDGYQMCVSGLRQARRGRSPREAWDRLDLGQRAWLADVLHVPAPRITVCLNHRGERTWMCSDAERTALTFEMVRPLVQRYLAEKEW